MDIQSIMTAVTTVGFPIYMVIWIELKNQKMDELNRQEKKELNELLTNFSLNIQENTMTLRELIGLIKNGKN